MTKGTHEAMLSWVPERTGGTVECSACGDRLDENGDCSNDNCTMCPRHPRYVAPVTAPRSTLDARRRRMAERRWTNGAADVCAGRSGNKPTSAEAHRRTRAGKGSVYQAVVTLLIQQGPKTCEEAETGLRVGRSTMSARWSELTADNVIVPTGETRPTSTGSPAAVMRIDQERARALGFIA